jgi:putative mRNA 3-end processing factor
MEMDKRAPTAARLPPWLTVTEAGLYCIPGGFHVDPSRPVDRAIVTHGHADHARPGHQALLATPETAAIVRLRHRDHERTRIEALPLGQVLDINGVALRFAAAGHILGSAQVVMEHGGTRVVVSGDFKRRADPTCAPFEVVPCDVFVTEATFGLPVFRHPDADAEVGRLLASLALFPDRCHVVGVYALGKCQRLIALLRAAGYDAPIHLHGALIALTALYEQLGIPLGPVQPVTAASKPDLKGAVVLAPPAAIADRWARGLPDPVVGLASGWMLIRQRARQRGVELPLVISDHADWDELTATIADVAAATLLVTHGQEDALVHYARRRGIDAAALSLAGRDDEGEAA